MSYLISGLHMRMVLIETGLTMGLVLMSNGLDSGFIVVCVLLEKKISTEEYEQKLTMHVTFVYNSKLLTY